LKAEVTAKFMLIAVCFREKLERQGKVNPFNFTNFPELLQEVNLFVISQTFAQQITVFLCLW